MDEGVFISAIIVVWCPVIKDADEPVYPDENTESGSVEFKNVSFKIVEDSAEKE